MNETLGELKKRAPGGCLGYFLGDEELPKIQKFEVLLKLLNGP